LKLVRDRSLFEGHCACVLESCGLSATHRVAQDMHSAYRRLTPLGLIMIKLTVFFKPPIQSPRNLMIFSAMRRRRSNGLLGIFTIKLDRDQV
jgi:hypothetical protein